METSCPISLIFVALLISNIKPTVTTLTAEFCSKNYCIGVEETGVFPGHRPCMLDDSCLIAILFHPMWIWFDTYPVPLLNVGYTVSKKVPFQFHGVLGHEPIGDLNITPEGDIINQIMMFVQSDAIETKQTVQITDSGCMTYRSGSKMIHRLDQQFPGDENFLGYYNLELMNHSIVFPKGVLRPLNSEYFFALPKVSIKTPQESVPEFVQFEFMNATLPVHFSIHIRMRAMNMRQPIKVYKIDATEDFKRLRTEAPSLPTTTTPRPGTVPPMIPTFTPPGIDVPSIWPGPGETPSVPPSVGQSTTLKSPSSKKSNAGFPVWAIVLLVLLALAIFAAVTTILVIASKKGKTKRYKVNDSRKKSRSRSSTDRKMVRIPKAKPKAEPDEEIIS